MKRNSSKTNENPEQRRRDAKNIKLCLYARVLENSDFALMKFMVGDRVKISSDYHWAQNATGTIVFPPKFAIELAADNCPWEDWHRLVKGRTQIIEFFFVIFDEPQFDADGDGPYRGAEIEGDVIEKIPK